jgi:16S rRNA (cytosine1402-N4)-methyltransferase
MSKTSPSTEYHIPVLLSEVVEGLQIEVGQWYVDGTIGGGGHAAAILAAGGKVLGIDQDAEALAEAERKLQQTKNTTDQIVEYRLVQANFRDLAEVVKTQAVGEVAGVLLDLGVSSHQLDALERGFSFRSDTLDMRMDAGQMVTAADLVARLGEADLTRLFADLGEERYARSMARAIVRAREQQAITSGGQLAEIIYKASPAAYRHGSLHPATRIFQALRLAVNDEIGSLEQVLPQAWSVLSKGGRLVVISFHSLEDRPVKHFMRQLSVLGQAKVLTARPLTATDQELRQNARSRSAKLRVAEKVV